MSSALATGSAYIRSLRGQIPPGEDAGTRIRDIAAKCWNLPPEQLPPEHMMAIIGSPDAGHFRSAMGGLFQELALRSGIARDATVLDLGCGCGRLALPFANYLDHGRYYGIDVWEEGLDWCRTHLGAAGDRLRFIHRVAANNYYFERRDAATRNGFHLAEIDHEEVDFAFAISLFTHLQQRDCLAYLGEMNRVLKRSGCAYLTCFLIDDFFFDYVRRTGLHRAVRQEECGCYYAYEGQDFFAGYTRAAWLRMIEDSGLRVVGYEPGTWAEKPGALHYQDSFVLVPAGYRRD